MIALPTLAPDVANVPELQVGGVAIDSREVTDGALFIALAGLEADGHDYIDAAVANGAVAVFAQRDVGNCPVPLVVLEDLAARVSMIAGEFFQHPSTSMQCVAVTGTNGKTSVAHFIAELANELGVSAGFLGTTGWGRVGDGLKLRPAALTTADAVSLQQRLADLKDQGCELVALELSSHALQQHRGDALNIDVALFTNLTRDHLDYHGDMEAYGAAKARLFDFPGLTGAVINAGDAFGAELFERCSAAHASESKSRESKGATVVLPLLVTNAEAKPISADKGSQVTISQLESHREGMSWKFESPWGVVALNTSVIGAYNAINLSLAVSALALLGYDLQRIALAVAKVKAPAGRLQSVGAADEASKLPSVFVDYAHTPDALVSVLTAVRAHCAGRIVCVFGCGGDRDAGKRAPMGRAVAEFADIGYLTSDNPRFEDPLSIIADVEAGLPENHKLRIEPDRRAAIAQAIACASSEDVILIAGKGHENYQDVLGVRQPFDDVDVARIALGLVLPASDAEPNAEPSSEPSSDKGAA